MYAATLILTIINSSAVSVYILTCIVANCALNVMNNSSQDLNQIKAWEPNSATAFCSQPHKQASAQGHNNNSNNKA